MKQNKAITMVALVVTIIVLIILAAISINVLLVENGIIIKAQKASELQTNAEMKEDTIINSIEEDIKDALTNYVKISEIYDATGEIEDKLHIGDFVNYKAGTWTADEINNIKVGLSSNLTSANNSLELPEKDYQFGGFKVGSSRDETSKIAPFDGLGTVEYIRNASNNEPISGWRIFDIDDSTGKVTLISAGNPEAYYQSPENNSGYISQYILSGEVHSSWNADTAANYQKRDWSDYVNEELKAESAYVLSKPQLEAWYNKYVGKVTDLWTQAQFKLIYKNERLHNIIDNYSFWWLSTARAAAGPHFVQGDSGRRLRGGNSVAVGIRVMVVLSSDITFSEKRVDTIELTSQAHMSEEYGGNQTYNVWNIK